VIHVAGRIDPMNDIEVINTELALADLDSVETALQARQRFGQGRRQGRDPQRRPAGEAGART
jgi:ribosome-binding ATPase YchF (GTP1/OBG family)